MKSLYLLAALGGLLFASACVNTECRDCDGFTYDAPAFNPDFAEADLQFRDVATGETVTFSFLQAFVSPPQQICSGEVNSPDLIQCVTGGTVSFRNQDLGIDMNLQFQANVPGGTTVAETVAMSYEFKGVNATRFTRTHGVVIEPTVEFVAGQVVRLDTLRLGDTLFNDVIDMRQPAAAFDPVGPVLPDAGRFTNIYFEPRGGLVGLRDVDERLFVRED